MEKQLARLLPKAFLKVFLFFILLAAITQSFAQNTGCLADRFGIDAGLYSGVIEFGTAIEPDDPNPRSIDWFTGSAGFGVIAQDPARVTYLTNLLQTLPNPMYEAPQKLSLASIFDGLILIDAIFARDEFGGTGHIDQTSYVQASKNGEDPAIWAPGPSNVLGKNDIIDVGGFMFREGTTISDNLWFVGLFNMAEPGGQSYMDFEFFVESVTYNQDQQQFTSGGPQLGHTAYNFDASGNITKIGDFIFSVSLLASGPVVETRLWVSRSDWQNITPTTFDWAGTFDGAFNNAPFGYAGIVPKPDAPIEFCGVINTASTLAPPWGTRNTKSNVYGTTYQERSIAEVAINLTAYGMDHASLLGDDECFFPLNTFIVKTRASASFTAQLKDFAGPYSWGSPSVTTEVIGEYLSCDNTISEVIAIPSQEGIEYEWSTIDGNIIEQVVNEPWKILVDKPGTYQVTATLETECFAQQTASAIVGLDESNPLFNDPVLLATTTSCEGNDGTISLNVTGANGPYIYTWNKDGSSYTTETEIAPGDHTLENLPPGTYSVTIQGTGDCTAFIDEIGIKARTPLDYTATQENVTCFGFTDGKIELGTVTGNEPLSYLWSTGNTSKDLLNIGAGSYTVWITDSDNCVTEQTFEVTQPTQITATISKTDDPGNAGNGSATVNASGGTPDYTYLWSKTDDPVFVFQPSNTANAVIDLSYGEYTVTVTDANGCSETSSVFIYEKEICDDGIDNDGDGLTDCDDPDCTPETPSAITPGDLLPCVGEEVTYSVINNLEVNEYVWTVPANATITGVQGTHEIKVIWSNTAGGQICVRAKIFDCLSAQVCYTASVDDVPAKPSEIIIDNN